MVILGSDMAKNIEINIASKEGQYEVLHPRTTAENIIAGVFGGNYSFDGQVGFTNNVPTCSKAPTTNNDLVNKMYADSLVQGGNVSYGAADVSVVSWKGTGSKTTVVFPQHKGKRLYCVILGGDDIYRNGDYQTATKVYYRLWLPFVFSKINEQYQMTVPYWYEDTNGQNRNLTGESASGFTLLNDYTFKVPSVSWRAGNEVFAGNVQEYRALGIFGPA